MAISKNEMDGIKSPDQNQMNKNLQSQGGYRSGMSTEFSRSSAQSFQAATKVHSMPERGADKTKKIEDEFLWPKKQTTNNKNRVASIKVFGRYVAKSAFVKAMIVMVLVCMVLLFLFPPITTNNNEVSNSRYENIFAHKGMTELKQDLYKNKAIFEIEALSSENPKDYRICTIGVKIRNYMPFEVCFDNFAVSKANITYEPKFVCAGIANDGGGVVSPFSSETFEVEVLVNVAGMSEEEFQKAVTSLMIKTNGLKRKIAKGVYCPTLPIYITVSNDAVFDLNS